MTYGQERVWRQIYKKTFIAGAEWQKQQSYTEDQIKQAIFDYCDENGMDDEEAKECVDDFINNFLNKKIEYEQN
jgi:polyhydroxyalkanoate synthesis regulator phasin